MDVLRGLRKLEERLDFSSERRERIYRKLAAYLRSGVKLIDALDMLYRHQTMDGRRLKSPTARIIAEWRRKVANGQNFGDAIAGYVPSGEAVLIRAGDESGRLDVALEDAIAISRARKKMVGAVVGGLAYPLLLLVLVFGFFGIFVFMVIPAFSEVYPREKWNGYPAIMADVADGMVAYGPWSLGAVIIALGLALSSLPWWVSPLRVQLERFPPWSVYKTLEGAGFLLSLSALIKAGVKLPDALRVMASNGSIWLRHRIMAAHRHVQNGLALGDALHRTRLRFPNEELVLDLRTYSNMDDFDVVLEKVAKEWIEQSLERIKKSFDGIRNGLLVLFGLMFMLIASGIFMMQNMITTGVAQGL
jgi:type II secretory pathway component PulF